MQRYKGQNGQWLALGGLTALRPELYEEPGITTKRTMKQVEKDELRFIAWREQRKNEIAQTLDFLRGIH